MYAIYGNIYHQYTPNVSIYTIITWILWVIRRGYQIEQYFISSYYITGWDLLISSTGFINPGLAVKVAALFGAIDVAKIPIYIYMYAMHFMDMNPSSS